MTNLTQFLDKDYLRLPTKNKIPLRKDWSLPINQYYKEPLTISQLLKTYQEYGIRLGLFIKRDYHLGVLYFRFEFSQLNYFANLFPQISYTQTENGLYYFALIKELLPNCSLKDLSGNLLGNFYGSGKLVIGPNSLINNYVYQFIPKKQDYLTFNSLQEFLNFLLKNNLQLTIQGSVQFNPQQQEWFCPKKLNQRWKARNKRNFAKTKQKLTKCPSCSRQLKLINLTTHLLKIHHRKSRSKKRLRTCSHCQTNYSTLIKIKEHQKFYCAKKNYEPKP